MTGIQKCGVLSTLNDSARNCRSARSRIRMLRTSEAYGASRLIVSRLYGVAPQDPATVSLATGPLLLVALGVAYLPARRASRRDPMAALRQE